MAKTKKAPAKSATGWEPADSCPFSQKDMKVIGPALMAMHNDGIDICVSNILSVAKQKNHPLHKYLYGVPDSQKIAEWLRNRAGDIVRSVRIIFTYKEKEKQHTGRTRAFVLIDKKPDLIEETKEEVPEVVREGVYVPVSELEDNPDWQQQVVARYAKMLASVDKQFKFYRDKYPKLAAQLNEQLKELLAQHEAAAVA